MPPSMNDPDSSFPPWIYMIYTHTLTSLTVFTTPFNIAMIAIALDHFSGWFPTYPVAVLNRDWDFLRVPVVSRHLFQPVSLGS
jgi:hypothetical protein